MLKSLDVLIGLTVVMLALSMAVTLLTQFVTTIVNSRGRHLRRGLVDLLGQIDPTLKEEIARKIAESVLTHPLISNTSRRLGSVVHREEFVKLALDLAGGNSLEHGARNALNAALKKNGIADPEATLKQIRTITLELEAADPHVALNIRQTIAILRAAQTDFVAKVNGWFDQTMDRVSQRFTGSTRAITFGAALLVAVVLQVDTIGLVNRLSADDTLRRAFVEQAMARQAASARSAVVPQTPSTGSQAGERASGTVPPAVIDRQYLAFLADNGLLTTARSWDEWWARWGGINVFGVLVTGLLLSLGAPFWYTALSRLLQLRSVLADSDDKERASRRVPAGEK
jgi:hypothetical protein